MMYILNVRLLSEKVVSWAFLSRRHFLLAFYHGSTDGIPQFRIISEISKKLWNIDVSNEYYYLDRYSLSALCTLTSSNSSKSMLSVWTNRVICHASMGLISRFWLLWLFKEDPQVKDKIPKRMRTFILSLEGPTKMVELSIRSYKLCLHQANYEVLSGL